MGETKPFFVSFAYRDDSQNLIIGRSDVLSLRLPDDPDAPFVTKPIEYEMFTVVTMTIVSTLVIFIMIVVYSVCGSFHKKADRVVMHSAE